MNRKKSGKYRIIASVMLFIVMLVLVGMLMHNRMKDILYHYMERQVAYQAQELSARVKLRFDMELQNMELLSECMEEWEQENQDFLNGAGAYLFPDKKEGTSTGLLSLDGNALYGKELDFSEFTGIRNAFRGNSSISFCQGKGLLFTVPVYKESNVKYVFYRLYGADILTEEFFVESFQGSGDMAIIDLNEKEIIPFQEHDFKNICKEPAVRDAYRELMDMLNVSSFSAVYYKNGKEENFMFVSEVPYYGFYLVGIVPDSVVSEGIQSLVQLIIWVFTLLIFLMVIGIAYLFVAEERAMENDELKVAKLVAENANKSKSDFLAHMSHEIRTPINAIIGMNEMVLRECREEDVKQYAVNIHSASQVLLSLVNDILDLSKIESGKMEIVQDNYQLKLLIDDTVNMMQIKADRDNLDFYVEVEETIPNGLYGDAVRNRQIMVNLLNNAVKYTKEGSVLFKIEAESRQKEEVLLKISVTDTGIGIKKEDMERLFDNFERLDLEKNHSVEGTGLGLAITKKLTEAMGGRIEVESEYGKGSVFTIYLPQKVIDNTPIGVYTKNIDTKEKKQGEYKVRFIAPEARILVVDDNEMNLLVVESLLKKTKIQVVTCKSGKECLSLIRKEHFHVIFLDHMMPEMDGIEVMRQLKTLYGNICQDIPVIALTANAIKGVRDMYIKEGFDDYLSKPIESYKLEEMLERYLPKQLILPATEEKEMEQKNVEQDLDTGKWIDPAAAMEYCAGDEEIYLEVLQMYCEDEEENRKKLENAIENQDYSTYTVEIHALKSTSLNIGSKKLYDAALALEQASKAGDIDYISKNHESCMKLYAKVVQEGKEYLREHNV